jgi:hypothetical protein
LEAKLGDTPYRIVFDPWEDVEAVEASMADDLADIYRDAMNALADPRGDRAVWDWKLSFRTHWGHHALAALYAIHALGLLTSNLRRGPAE